jgi:hypothetical protein
MSYLSALRSFGKNHQMTTLSTRRTCIDWSVQTNADQTHNRDKPPTNGRNLVYFRLQTTKPRRGMLNGLTDARPTNSLSGQGVLLWEHSLQDLVVLFMKSLAKFVRGETGLAVNFWFGYVVSFWLIVIVIFNLMDRSIISDSWYLINILIAWLLFSGLAVFNAAFYKRGPSPWGKLRRPSIGGKLAIISVTLFPILVWLLLTFAISW